MGKENERIGKTKQAKMLKQAVIKIEVTLLLTCIDAKHWTAWTWGNDDAWQIQWIYYEQIDAI